MGGERKDGDRLTKTYMNDINTIIRASEGEYLVRGKIAHKIGNKYVNIWRDNEEYLNGLQYTDENTFLWTWSNPQEFVVEFLTEGKVLMLEVASMRYYGQSKLVKPTELKGIKQSLSVDYIPKKARCSVFITGDDVWIKHPDYFSESISNVGDDLGAPLEVLANKYLGKDRNKKFVYGDAWGAVVLRNESWLCVRNLLRELRKPYSNPLEILGTILRQQEQVHGFDRYSLDSSDMCRMFERLISEVSKYQEAQ